MCLWVLGFDSMIKFIYSGDQKIITTIQDLDLLFEIYRLTDKVKLIALLSLRTTSICFLDAPPPP